MTTDRLRLAMQHGPTGVMRIVAQFPAEHAAEVARHAAAIAALSPGCRWGIQTTTGRQVDTPVDVPQAANPPPPAPPVEPTLEPPKVSAIAGLWALICRHKGTP